MLCYLFGFQPFIDKKMNYLTIFNECCSLLLIYNYLFFKQSFEKKYSMGVTFNFIYVFSMIVNILNLFYDIIIPKMKDDIKKLREWKFNRDYE
jgi:hypothetical protein